MGKDYRNPIIVAHRSPVDFNDPDTLPDLAVSGLVQAVTGIKGKILWVGYGAGKYDKHKMDEELKIRYKSDLTTKKFFIEKSIYDIFYNFYCNGKLWDTLHLTNGDITDGRTYPLPYHDPDNFKYYKLVNSIFRDYTLGEYFRDKRPVWVHDYHLMMFPSMFREMDKEAVIGHFMHTPFFNIKDQVVQEILKGFENEIRDLIGGMLGSDLIGFHIPEYVKYFINAVEEYFASEASVKRKGDYFTVEYKGHKSKVKAFPIGVNIGRVLKGAKSSREWKNADERVLKLKGEIDRVKKKGVEVIITLGRLDYTKGDYESLEIFEKMLKTGFKGLLVSISKLSRPSSPGYENLRLNVEEKAKKINLKFRKELGYDPVLFDVKGINYPYNILIMRDNTVLVPSLEDGMNLIVPEAVLSRNIQR